jgi:glycosyltransferase involved in cell wall biosynthesis
MRIFAYNDFILTKREGKIYADDSHILFIKSTCTDHFDEFCLGSRVSANSEKGYYFFTDQESNLLELPYYASVSDFLRKPRLLFSAFRLLKSQMRKFDVFWITWPHPISLLILVMIGSKKPVVLFVRQNLEELIKVRYSGIQRRVGIAFVRIVYLYASKFRTNAMLVTVGKEMYESLSKDFSKSKYISDSIVSEEVSTVRTYPFGKALKLLFVGRLEPEKGLEDLIRAVELINKNISASLTIVGEGESRVIVEHLVRTLQLHEKVSFRGYIPFGEELFDLYTSHDILMISSYSEGLPKIINEARAFSIPIVSTKVGGIADELRDQETCLFVAPGEPFQLANAAIRLFSDHELYDRICTNLNKEFEKNSLQYWSREFAEFVKSGIDKEIE